MEVIIKKNGNKLQECEIPFSINDIVKIRTYGLRYSDQKRAYDSSTFRNSAPLKKWPHENENCEICNSKYNNIEWKITDIGVFFELYDTEYSFLIIRLINRYKEELLVQLSIFYPQDCLDFIRIGGIQEKIHVIEL